MKKRLSYMVCVLLFSLILLGGSISAEEYIESGILGVQIPWTPVPHDNLATPRPEEVWVPDEEVLAGAYSADALIAGGVGTRILMRGMQGEDVALLQKRLYDLGYLTSEADGRYGRQTFQAVLAFQRQNGLSKVDGKAGSETLNCLFSRDALAMKLEDAVLTPEPNSIIAPTIAPSAKIILSPTPTPNLGALSFATNMMEVYLGEKGFLLPSVQEEDCIWYPLTCIMSAFGYVCDIQDGSWVFQSPLSETVMILGSDVEGRMEYIMGSVGDSLFLEEEDAFAGQQEVWVSSRLLRRIGFSIVEVKGVTVIWKP